MERANKLGPGPELYDAVQRLIFEWRGCDEGERTAAIPKLIKEIVALAEGPEVAGKVVRNAEAA